MKAPNGADLRALRVANTAEDVLAATRRCGKRDSDNDDLEVDYIRI